jgi:enamine deaminase RidA (YjgF/YER057c/UK114 family)
VGVRINETGSESQSAAVDFLGCGSDERGADGSDAVALNEEIGLERRAARPVDESGYSQVVRAGDFLYISGQGPIDRATQEFVFSDVRGETRLTLANSERVLEGCGASKKTL